MNFNLEGKTALVTGGSKGLGKSIAIALAKAGANVAIVSRTKQDLEKAIIEIKEHNTQCYYKALDVRDKKGIAEFAEFLYEQAGSIDILVNASGINKKSSFLDITENDWDDILDINLKGIYYASQAIIPYMQKKGYGKIINIGSLTSAIALPNMVAYAASKGGTIQFTKSLAMEFAKDGICVNAIGPGYFSTDLTKSLMEDPEKVTWMESRIPMGRIGTPEALQGTAVFLASPASDYVTGQTIYVDGGWLSN